MALAVTLVDSGGIAITDAASLTTPAVPMTPVTSGGIAVTQVASGGLPVVLLTETGDLWLLGQATEYLNGIEPYHWFDFINNRALVAQSDVGVLSSTPGWSFARASAGFYTNADGTLTSFASGALRRGDRGVLIEGARTNSFLQSQDFQTSWTLIGLDAFGSGSVANAVAAPDGTVTADFIRPTTGLSSHRIAQSVTHTAASWTGSVYVKAGGYSRFGMSVSGSYATFNLETGAVIETNGTAVISALANGWYRCALTFTATAASLSWDLYVLDALYLSGSPHLHTFMGDGVSGLYLWGAQCELGASQSSYIPTTTGTATREADVLTIASPGVNYPLSIFVEYQRLQDTGAVESLIQMDTVADGNNERCRLIVSASDTAQAFLVDGGSNVGNVQSAATISAGATARIAGRFNTNSVNIALNGIAATEDSTATLPNNPDRIIVGSTALTNLQPFNYILRLAIFNGALSDADLQTATT